MEKYGVLVVPAILVIIFVVLLPFIAVINYSFQTPYSGDQFVGFLHYRNLFKDERLQDVFTRNLLFTTIALLTEIPLGLGLAYCFYKPSKTSTITSMIIAIPALLPGVTIGLIWRLMIRSTGPIPVFLRNYLNYIFEPFINPSQAFWILIAVDIWHWTSLSFIIFASALAGLDPTPTLSARTEGATRWQIFRFIEVPSLKFPLIFITLIRFMDSFKIYDEPTVITGGGPGLATEFLSMYIKRLGLDQWQLGYASAISMIYLFVVLIACFILIQLMTKGRGLSS